MSEVVLYLLAILLVAVIAACIQQRSRIERGVGKSQGHPKRFDSDDYGVVAIDTEFAADYDPLKDRREAMNREVDVRIAQAKYGPVHAPVEL